jgi:hypothetical protein
LKCPITKRFRVERRGKKQGREEKCLANGNTSKKLHFIKVHLGPKGGYILVSEIVWNIGLGLREFGNKMVPYKHYIIV